MNPGTSNNQGRKLWNDFRGSKLAVLALLFLARGEALGVTLQVKIVPRFNGAPLLFDSLTNQTAAGQNISVTRLNFILSDVGLRRVDGAWIERTNWFAYISGQEDRTSFGLEAIPAGTYERLRFHVGLESQVNHADATQWPAGHPLNPQVNGLHWGWAGGYVFLALEGRWESGSGPARDAKDAPGYSFHLANDAQLMTVELPVELKLTADTELNIAMDVGRIFGGVNRIDLTENTDTTHSRTNDALAGILKGNVESAFAVENLQPARTHFTGEGVRATAKRTASVVMAPNATPYRFTFSKFFPRPELPRDNPLTVEGVSLGSQLFFDRRLSADNSQSCAACHHPQDGFAEHRRFSRGIGGEIGTRNAMALENLAWKSGFFWDGRAASLREQVLQPIQNPIEMHESLDYLVKKLARDEDYPRLFANAFGSSEITADRIARALEQFLLVQVSFDSKFDHVIAGKEKFTDEEQRGFMLFHTEYDPYHGQYGADCFHCHGGPLFQSQSFANNGLDTEFKDVGRYAVTKREGDRGKFAVPSLRNVAVTAPYMHDGRFQTLEEVVEHYCTGMKRTATLDPNLAKHPGGGVPLSEADKRALVAFLKTLTDERFFRND